MKMFRETLQTLACLSVLAGTYSLHMARDAYRRPGLSELSAMEKNQESAMIDEQLRENSFPESIKHMNTRSHMTPRRDNDNTPRGLQELFGEKIINDVESGMRLNDHDLRSDHIVDGFQGRIDTGRIEEHRRIDDLHGHLSGHHAGNGHRPIIFGTNVGSVSSVDIDAANNIVSGSVKDVNNKRSNMDHGVGGNKANVGGVGGGSSGSASMVQPNLPPVPHGIASQLMLRTARGQRQYDVPQIGEFCFKINSSFF